MNPELLQIPKRIRELREILDLSTIEVAEKLGVTLDEYQRYESGEQDIPVSTLYEIANILGTDCPAHRGYPAHECPHGRAQGRRRIR